MTKQEFGYIVAFIAQSYNLQRKIYKVEGPNGTKDINRDFDFRSTNDTFTIDLYDGDYTVVNVSQAGQEVEVDNNRLRLSYEDTNGSKQLKTVQGAIYFRDIQYSGDRVYIDNMEYTVY